MKISCSALASLFAIMVSTAASAEAKLRGAAAPSSQQQLAGDHVEAEESEETRALLSLLPPEYIVKKGYACRTSHFGYGIEGKDYEKRIVHSYDECQDICSFTLFDECEAFEYNSANNVCEIWKTEPTKFEQISHTLSCSVKKADYVPPPPLPPVYEVYEDMACRTHSGGKGVQDQDYYLFNKVWSEYDCEELCSDKDYCEAYEYNYEGKRCELWAYHPKFEHKKGFVCNLKYQALY